MNKRRLKRLEAIVREKGVDVYDESKLELLLKSRKKLQQALEITQNQIDALEKVQNS